VTGQHKPSTWADTYLAMRTILDTVIKAQRGARRPTADVPSLIRVRRDLGQLDRGTYQPCTQSATAAILRLAADLADQNNADRTAVQVASGRLDEGGTVPVPDALPVWAQRCSCGGQGITHLAAEHHEPVGPADVDPHAGRACDLCGDYVTGPCPTCAPATVAALARVRQIAPALDFEATAPGMHDAAREALRDASRRIRTALGTLPETEPLPRPAGLDDLLDHVAANLPPSYPVLMEVAMERTRQNAKWGEQNHPDGTGGLHHVLAVDDVRRGVERAAAEGRQNWANVMGEEVAEAFAESDPARLHAELVQVAAVATAWIEAIDRRPAAGSDDTCRVIEVDGQPIRVHGAGEMTDQDRAALAEVLGAARRKYAAEHPETAPQDEHAARDCPAMEPTTSTVTDWANTIDEQCPARYTGDSPHLADAPGESVDYRCGRRGHGLDTDHAMRLDHKVVFCWADAIAVYPLDDAPSETQP
jgi:hypothetical protein